MSVKALSNSVIYDLLALLARPSIIKILRMCSAPSVQRSDETWLWLTLTEMHKHALLLSLDPCFGKPG